MKYPIKLYKYPNTEGNMCFTVLIKGAFLIKINEKKFVINSPWKVYKLELPEIDFCITLFGIKGRSVVKSSNLKVISLYNFTYNLSIDNISSNIQDDFVKLEKYSQIDINENRKKISLEFEKNKYNANINYKTPNINIMPVNLSHLTEYKIPF